MQHVLAAEVEAAGSHAQSTGYRIVNGALEVTLAPPSQARANLPAVRAGDRDVRAMRLFHGSITYLALLFLSVALDPLLTR